MEVQTDIKAGLYLGVTVDGGLGSSPAAESKAAAAKNTPTPKTTTPAPPKGS